MTPRDLQIENETLKRQLAEARAAIADRDAKIEKLAKDVATLEAAVKHLLTQRRSGYRIQEGQGLLFPESAPAGESPQADGSTPVDGAEAEAADDTDEDGGDSPRKPRGEATKRRALGKIDTTGLRRVDRLHDVPQDQRIDPTTGKPLVQIGEKVFEELDYTRAQLIVICHRQLIYGLPPEEAEHRTITPVVADMPPRPLENSAASANLLAWLLVQKYANHLPLYRQEEIFGRDGRRLPRQTLCDWVLAAAEQLQPIVGALMQKIRAGPVMQIDDTPVMCQGGKGEQNFQAYLWTFVNPEVDGVVYRFTSGRASELLADELGDFHGVLVGDGYSGNRAAANKTGGEITIAGCWAHVTRKFRDAESEAPGTAKLFRDDIKKLYAIERVADDAGLTPQARGELRRQEAMPILIEIYSRTWRLRGRFNESGAMAKAIGYVRGQHRALRQYLEDGRIPIDNNSCERSIRPIAIGRRNWLFAGSLRGGRAAAVVYTLIECCRRANVDMVSYLADVLVRIATHPASRVEELLPANWPARFAAQAPEFAFA